MEKIPSPLYFKLPPTTIYLDDLLTIVKLLESNNLSVEIRLTHESHDYKFISSDDLGKSKIEIDTFHELRMTGHNSNVFFNMELLRNSANINIDLNTTQTQGLLTQIKSILLKRKKSFWSTNAIIIPLCVFGATLLPVVFGLVFLITKGDTEVNYTLAISFIISLLWLLPLWNIMEYKYSTIHLVTHKSMPSFFSRRKDEIAIAVIAAFAGGVITFLVNLFITNQNI